MYSPTGDFLGLTDTAQGVVSYRYDRAHRLAEETLPDGSRRAFGHDPAGNLLFQPGLTGVEMDSGNRLRAANGDRFTYDGRDHLCTREGPAGTTRYEYNALDMLIRCEIHGESWTADYDALCRRIRKSWRGQTTVHYWDDFRLAAEQCYDGSLRVYVYEDHTALVPFMFVEYAALDSDPASGKRFYIFTNQIGVPIRVEDDAGRSCWSARIDPYGLAHVSPDSTREMPLRFPGHYHDPETGLHYNRFRYFSPELGRYLQSDPAGLEGAINVYAYPADPLTGADIDGLVGKGGKGGSGKPSSRPSGKPKEGVPAGTAAGCPVLAAVPAGKGADLVMGAKASAKEHPGNWDLYTNPGHHDPGHLPLRTAPYNPTKSVIPPNHVDLFTSSVRTPDGTRWAVEGGRPPVYHRFQETQPNVYHYNGSTNGKTAAGTPRPIPMGQVPVKDINSAQ